VTGDLQAGPESAAANQAGAGRIVLDGQSELQVAGDSIFGAPRGIATDVMRLSGGADFICEGNTFLTSGRITASGSDGASDFSDILLTGDLRVIGSGFDPRPELLLQDGAQLQARELSVTDGQVLLHARGTLNEFGVTAVNKMSVGASGPPAVVGILSRGRVAVITTVDVFRSGVIFLQRGATLQADEIRVSDGGAFRKNREATVIEIKSKQDEPPVKIEGTFILESGGRLIIESEPGQGPEIVFSGATQLSGSLEIDFPGDAPLTAGDLLELIEFAGGVTGGFSDVSFPNRTPDFVGETEIVDGILRVRVIDPGQPLAGEGEGEDEGEGETEGEGEGDGEPVAPGGCRGCDGAGGAAEKALGDWLVFLFGFSVLLGTQLLLRRRASQVA
jgi:hypothetical protein